MLNTLVAFMVTDFASFWIDSSYEGGIGRGIQICVPQLFFFYQKAVSLLVKKQKKSMTQIVLTVPNGEVSFLSTLAEKMGWSFQTSENLVEKFIASCPTDVSISDEEIQAEVNAVRYAHDSGKENGSSISMTSVPILS